MIIVLLYIVLKKKRQTHRRKEPEFDVAIGNHALRAIVLISKITCKLLANEKTDGEYNV